MSRRATTAGVAVIVLLISCLAAYIAWSPCEIVIPMFDSKQLEATEAQELWVQLQRAHAENARQAVPNSALFPALPAPLKVESVWGRWATISVNGPMPRSQIEYQYGGAWQAVYAKHHGGGPLTCVYIRYLWKSGGISTACCRAEL